MGISDPTTRERVRYHLGYPTLAIAPTISMGIPARIQTSFLVDAALDNAPPETQPRVLAILNTLDNIECLLREAPGHKAVAKSGNTELRENESELLEDDYSRWQGRLADLLGAPRYPYSQRTQNAIGVMSGSLPVRG